MAFLVVINLTVFVLKLLETDSFAVWVSFVILTESECDSNDQQTSHVATFQTHSSEYPVSPYKPQSHMWEFCAPHWGILCITWWDTKFVTWLMAFSVFLSKTQKRNDIRLLSAVSLELWFPLLRQEHSWLHSFRNHCVFNFMCQNKFRLKLCEQIKYWKSTKSQRCTWHLNINEKVKISSNDTLKNKSPSGCYSRSIRQKALYKCSSLTIWIQQSKNIKIEMIKKSGPGVYTVYIQYMPLY